MSILRTTKDIHVREEKGVPLNDCQFGLRVVLLAKTILDTVRRSTVGNDHLPPHQSFQINCSGLGKVATNS